MIFALLVAFWMSMPGFSSDDDVRAAQVHRQAVAVLSDHYADQADRFEVRVKRVTGRFDPSENLRVVFPTDTHPPKGTTQVQLLAEQEGTWQGVGWAILYIAHFDSVLIVQEALSEGEAVTASSLAATWQETTTFPGQPVSPDAWRDLLAQESTFAARTLRKGQVLREGDLRQAFAARTGDTIKLAYQRGKIALTIPCTARQNGFIGDEIRLYASQTQTTYRARLTAQGTAQWLSTL